MQSISITDVGHGLLPFERRCQPRLPSNGRSQSSPPAFSSNEIPFPVSAGCYSAKLNLDAIALSSKAIWMRSGSLRGSIYLVLLLLGRFGVSQTIIPEAKGHFLIPSAHRHNHLFGGLGLTPPYGVAYKPGKSIGVVTRNESVRMRQSWPAANGYQALALAAPVAFSGTEGSETPLRLFQGLSVALTHGVPWGTRWKSAFSPGSARLHERCLGMLPARMNSVLTW